MPNEREPRSSTAAKKTTRKPVTKSNQTSDPEVPVTSEPVSTASPATTTARNPVITGNASIDLDAVRRRAYELYEERGRQSGYEAEDWLRAEREFQSKRPNRQREYDSERDLDTKKSA